MAIETIQNEHGCTADYEEGVRIALEQNAAELAEFAAMTPQAQAVALALAPLANEPLAQKRSF